MVMTTLTAKKRSETEYPYTSHLHQYRALAPTVLGNRTTLYVGIEKTMGFIAGPSRTHCAVTAHPDPSQPAKSASRPARLTDKQTAQPAYYLHVSERCARALVRPATLRSNPPPIHTTRQRYIHVESWEVG
jgi:hypothetical protein